MLKRILAYRFSSFGDVILTIPVIISFLNEHEEVEMVFFTRSKFAPFFPEHKQLTVIGIDLKNSFSGLSGLLNLFSFIRSKAGNSKLVLDFHSVLRTRLLNTLLFFSGFRIVKIRKPRKQRKRYIKGHTRTALPRVLELYSAVIHRAGYNFHLIDPPYIGFNNQSQNLEINTKRIGIAPFSQHRTKTWPFENMLKLLSILNNEIEADFFLFGSQPEIESLSSLEKEQFIIPVANTSPKSEISLIRSLDLMISMDSANMHLADIMGIKVISIWGGTHPDLGFKPSFQRDSRLISSKENLDCRPCSVYGKDNCALKGFPYKCLITITPEDVANKVLKEL